MVDAPGLLSKTDSKASSLDALGEGDNEDENDDKKDSTNSEDTQSVAPKVGRVVGKKTLVETSSVESIRALSDVYQRLCHDESVHLYISPHDLSLLSSSPNSNPNAPKFDAAERKRLRDSAQRKGKEICNSMMQTEAFATKGKIDPFTNSLTEWDSLLYFEEDALTGKKKFKCAFCANFVDAPPISSEDETDTAEKEIDKAERERLERERKLKDDIEQAEEGERFSMAEEDKYEYHSGEAAHAQLFNPADYLAEAALQAAALHTPETVPKKKKKRGSFTPTIKKVATLG